MYINADLYRELQRQQNGTYAVSTEQLENQLSTLTTLLVHIDQIQQQSELLEQTLDGAWLELYKQRFTWLHALAERGADVIPFVTAFDAIDWNLYSLTTWLANEVVSQKRPQDTFDTLLGHVILTSSPSAPILFELLNFPARKQYVKTALGHMPFITGQTIDPNEDWEQLIADVSSDYDVLRGPITWSIRFDMLDENLQDEVKTIVRIKLNVG